MGCSDVLDTTFGRNILTLTHTKPLPHYQSAQTLSREKRMTNTQYTVYIIPNVHENVVDIV
jgi:hypothetical protein